MENSILTPEFEQEINNLEAQVYNTDAPSEPEQLQELADSNGLITYVDWMEAQLLKRKAKRLDIIREVCNA